MLDNVASKLFSRAFTALWSMCVLLFKNGVNWSRQKICGNIFPEFLKLSKRKRTKKPWKLPVIQMICPGLGYNFSQGPMQTWEGILEQFLKSEVLITKCFSLQLRETVNNFCQKELAPYADQIDKENNFPQLRVSVHNITKKSLFSDPIPHLGSKNWEVVSLLFLFLIGSCLFFVFVCLFLFCFLFFCF